MSTPLEWRRSPRSTGTSTLPGAAECCSTSALNVDLDAISVEAACSRSTALVEFIGTWNMQGSTGSRTPSYVWHHPGSGVEIARRLDIILTTVGPWAVKALGAGRSDHVALLARRASRSAACQRAWRPSTWQGRRQVNEVLSRSFAGARTCQEVQRGLMAAARSVKPELRPPDDLHDELGALAAWLREKRASRPPGPPQAPDASGGCQMSDRACASRGREGGGVPFGPGRGRSLWGARRYPHPPLPRSGIVARREMGSVRRRVE